MKKKTPDDNKTKIIEKKTFPNKWQTRTDEEGKTVYILTEEEIKQLYKDIHAIIPAEQIEATNRLIISASEVHKIKGLEDEMDEAVITERIDAFKRLTPQDYINIRLAANAGDPELFRLVCDIVYRLMIRLIVKDALRIKNGDYTQVGDLIDNAFLSVQKHIREYNGLYALSTFFKNYIYSDMLDEKYGNSAVPLNSTQKTNKIRVTKAIEEMRKEGNLDPTPEEVQKYINKTRGYDIPKKSIARAMNSDHSVVSLSEYLESEAVHPQFPSPEQAFLEQERIDERIEAFKRLTPKHAEALKLYYFMIDDPNRKRFNNTDYVDLYRKYIDKNVRPDVALRYLNEGKRKLRMFYGHVTEYEDTDFTGLRMDEEEINEDTAIVMEVLQDEELRREVFSVDSGDDLYLEDVMSDGESPDHDM